MQSCLPINCEGCNRFEILHYCYPMKKKLCKDCVFSSCTEPKGDCGQCTKCSTYGRPLYKYTYGYDKLLQEFKSMQICWGCRDNMLAV
jgi:hypothetical protein